MRNFQDNVKKTGVVMKVLGIITLVFSIFLLLSRTVEEVIPNILNIAFSVVCIILGHRIKSLNDKNTGKYLGGCLLMLVLMSTTTGRIGGILTIIAYVNVLFGLDSFYRLNKYHNIKESLKHKTYPLIINLILIIAVLGFLVSSIWYWVA